MDRMKKYHLILNATFLACLVIALVAVWAKYAHADPNPAPATLVSILVVGDSNTAASGDHPVLRQLLTDTGYAPTVVNKGIGGIGCKDIAPQVAGWVAQADPDWLLLSCGTNDSAATAADRAAFKTAYGAIVANALTASPKLRIIWSWIGYSNFGEGNTSPAWLENNEPQINDLIYQWRFTGNGPPNAARIPAWADFQKLPPAYRDAAGIHYSGAGRTAREYLWFNALMIAQSRAERAPLMCGLNGHRPGSDLIAAIACEGAPS